MRAALRQLASVTKSTQYLEPGSRTGLTGVLTHASPRSTLLSLYHSTLEKLRDFPEHSVYRQSTEALTRHRMSILEQVKPAGLQEWQKRIGPIVDQHPEAFRKVVVTLPSGDKEYNIVWKQGALQGMKNEEWDDEEVGKPMPEGIRTEAERAYQAQLSRDVKKEQSRIPRIESEPPLTIDQINEIESKIGAGLIEEVIEVAEGESTLVSTLHESKAWEDLEEKPQGNQWSYHERDTFATETQTPP